MDGNVRFDALDGARGLAAIGVVVYHSQLSYLAPWYWGAMDFFFVMSGLLITRALIKLKSQGRGLTRFLWYRITRLMPVMMLVIFSYELVVNLILDHHDGWPSISYLLLYQNTDLIIYDEKFFTRIDPLEHFWSLILEEQYYVIWSCLFFFTPISSFRNNLSVLSIFCFFLIAPTAFRFTGIDYWTLPARYDGFLLGSALGLLIFLRRDTLNLILKNRLVKSIIIIMLGLCAYRLSGSITQSYQDINAYRSEDSYWLDTLCYVLISATFLTNLLMYPESRLALALKNRTLIWLGLISYEMYVIHFPIVHTIRKVFAFNFEYASLVLLTLTLLITLPLSHIAHSQITRPSLNNRDISYEYLARRLRKLKMAILSFLQFLLK
jgi:peptidoglycan/LPS O-acetylase OafA/YrhL